MNVYLTLVKGINLVLVPSFPQFFHILLDFSQLKDTNMGKYISFLGRIFRVLNIDHISHSIPYAVVFDDVLMCPYMEI